MKVYIVFYCDHDLSWNMHEDGIDAPKAFFDSEAANAYAKIDRCRKVFEFEVSNEFRIEDLPIIKKFREFVANLECTKHKDFLARLNHAILGVGGEAGELLGAYKKQFIYPEDGKLDLEKWEDESCDLLHYFIGLTNVLGISIDKLIELNIVKLEERYPNGYSEDKALSRDRKKEAEAMRKVKE